MSEREESSDSAAEQHAAAQPAPEAVPPVADGGPALVAGDAGLAEAVGGGLGWLPYAFYLGAWLLLSAATAFLLKGASPEDPARWMPAYPALVWTGVGLAAAGPVVSLGVWLAARRSRPSEARRGLLAVALIRGALTAVFGVVIWIATLYALELAAAGALL